VDMKLSLTVADRKQQVYILLAARYGTWTAI